MSPEERNSLRHIQAQVQAEDKNGAVPGVWVVGRNHTHETIEEDAEFTRLDAYLYNEYAAIYTVNELIEWLVGLAQRNILPDAYLEHFEIDDVSKTYLEDSNYDAFFRRYADEEWIELFGIAYDDKEIHYVYDRDEWIQNIHHHVSDAMCSLSFMTTRFDIDPQELFLTKAEVTEYVNSLNQHVVDHSPYSEWVPYFISSNQSPLFSSMWSFLIHADLKTE